mgnify:CR=1 FL=1
MVGGCGAGRWRAGNGRSGGRSAAGSRQGRGRREMLERVASGEAGLVVGTHALIQQDALRLIGVEARVNILQNFPQIGTGLRENLDSLTVRGIRSDRNIVAVNGFQIGL